MNPNEIGSIWELDGIKYIILDMMVPRHMPTMGPTVMYSYKPVVEDIYHRNHFVCEAYEFTNKFSRVDDDCPLKEYIKEDL